MTDGDVNRHGLGEPEPGGIWAGWAQWTGNEPFESHAGPFYARRGDDGRYVCGFRPGANNMNGYGSVHGGALMTFADYALFLIAEPDLQGRPAVTITLNSEFVGAAREGALLTAQGDTLRAGRSLVFVRGLIQAGEQAVLNFSGVLKVV